MRQIGKALAIAIALVVACSEGLEPVSSSARLLGDDPDRDGVIDIADNCPIQANPTQSNRDGDELGDMCDPCPTTGLNVDGCPMDDDRDRVADAMDNCPGTANPDQADADGNGRGDACELRVAR